MYSIRKENKTTLLEVNVLIIFNTLDESFDVSIAHKYIPSFGNRALLFFLFPLVLLNSLLGCEVVSTTC